MSRPSSDISLVLMIHLTGLLLHEILTVKTGLILNFDEQHHFVTWG